MDLMATLREYYFKAEDKYYEAVEKINEKVEIVPYIDKIDSYVPSFVLLILLLLLLFFLVVWFIFFAPGTIVVQCNPETDPNCEYCDPLTDSQCNPGPGKKVEPCIGIGCMFGIPDAGGGDAIPAGSGRLVVEVTDLEGMPIAEAALKVKSSKAIQYGDTSGDGISEFYVPLEDTVTIEVERSGYESKERTIFIGDLEIFETISLTSEDTGEISEYLIEFVDSSGKRLLGKKVTASFTCSEPVFAPAATSTVEAEMKVIPPIGCGTLNITADADGYKAVSQALTFSNTIVFEALEKTDGVVRVTVLDAETNEPLIDDSIKVKLVSESQVWDETKYTDWGEAEFSNLTPGTYSATAEDEDKEYAIATVTGIEVSAGELTEAEIPMGKSIRGVLKVDVKGLETGTAIEGAEIEVRDEDGTLVVDDETDEQGKAEFQFFEAGAFTVSAYKEEYLNAEPVLVDMTEAVDAQVYEETIELELLTEENAGRVTVNVEDEEGLSVENAVVNVYDAETDLLAGVPEGITDANGTVQFKGLDSGAYYVKAYKYPAEVQSDSQEVDVKENTVFDVVMEIGEAEIEITAVDEDGDAIPNARAAFKSPSGEEIGAIELGADGTARHLMKADKSVSVTVSKAGYLPYSTEVLQLYKDETTDVDAVLKAQITGDTPVVEFLGMYLEDNPAQEVNQLTAGEEYIAKFNFSVPSGQKFKQTGLHVRTGNDRVDLVEGDALHISGINTPRASYTKGKTYNPPTGYEFDSANFTNSKAKWANIVWTEAESEAGSKIVHVEVKVNKDIAQGTPLELQYRTWGVVAGSRYFRDPVDSALGEAAEVSAKQGLYAETYKQIFYESAPALCDEEFCFTERVYDVAEEIYIDDEPYHVGVFGDYEYTFEITNNNDSHIHNNATLRMKNSSDGTVLDRILKIGGYEIINADSEVSSGTADDYELPWIGTGNFSPNKSISGKVSFIPQDTKNSKLNTLIVSDGTDVFDQKSRFSVDNEEDLVIEITPSLVPAYAEVPIEAKVVYGRGDRAEMPVENAIVTMVKKAPSDSGTGVSKQATTGQDGRAEFVIDPSSPNTSLEFSVQKPKHECRDCPYVAVVSCGLVEISESSLSSDLDIIENKEEIIDEIVITSRVEHPIEITAATIEDESPGGSFKGLLDVYTMAGYLDTFVAGTKFTQKGEEKEVSVKTAVTEDAIELIDEEEEFEATLKLDVSGDSFTQKCVFEVPMDISVDLGPGAEEEDCLTIDNPDWSGTALIDKVHEFYITNNCVTSTGEELTVKDLEAELSWGSNVYGTVSLSIANSAQATFTNSGTKEMFIELEPGEDYIGKAVFNPSGKYVNELPDEPAQFSIDLEGRAGGAKGKVHSSKSVEADLTFVDLRSCVEVTTETGEGRIELKAGEDAEDSQTLTITNNCGVNVDLTLCGYDGGKCSGADDGSIEGRLRLSDWNEPKLEDGDVWTVDVQKGDIPGYYDVKIEARVEGEASHKPVMLLPVIVHPDGKRYPASGTANFFTMPFYKITLAGVEAEEVVALKNNFFAENVSVRADECDWGDSSDRFDYTGAGFAAGAGIGTVIGSGLISASVGIVGGIKIGLTWGSWGGPPGMIIGAIVGGIVGAIAGGLFGDDYDCSDHHDTHSLMDYITNLKDDFRGINVKLESGKDSSLIEVEARVSGEDKEKMFIEERAEGMPFHSEYVGVVPSMAQVAGLRIVNKGLQTGEPIYGVMEIEFDEHAHGDSSHMDRATVNCGNGKLFGPFHIAKDWGCSARGNATNEEFTNSADPWESTAKIHLRFDTLLYEDALPDVEFDTVNCQKGSLIGLTGEDALPKVSYNWAFGNTIDSGVSWDYCDATRGSEMYCDATQFTIMLNKRMNILYEFLKENHFKFECPTDLVVAAVEKENEGNSTREVEDGELNLSEVHALVEGTNATITTTIVNNTDEDKTGKISFCIDEQYNCAQESFNIVSDDSQEISHTFTGLENEKTYMSGFDTVTSGVYHSAAVGIINPVDKASELTLKFYMGADEGCTFPKITETIAGESGIMPFVGGAVYPNEEPWVVNGVKCTGEECREILQELLYFRANLMRDGYSEYFLDDFAYHYSERELFNTPTYFSDLGIDSSGEPYGLDRLLEGDGEDRYFAVARKYIYETTSATPGVYQVDMAGVFFGDDWEFFDSDGTPQVLFTTIIDKVSNPAVPSPFYYLPLDGQLGIDNGIVDRRGYGAGFSNENIDDYVQFDNYDIDPLMSFDKGSSNTMITIDTEVLREIKELQVDEDTAGILLAVRADTGGGEIKFGPHYATPVMMKVHNENADSEQFAAYYSVYQGANADIVVDTGPSLASWSGAGSCLDFEGSWIIDSFYNREDRAAEKNETTNWLYAYAADMGYANETGDVYLRSIFYTPANDNTALKAEGPSEQGRYVKFITPDSAESTSVALNGVAGMEFNSRSAATDRYIKSVQDVFDLVKEGKVCVSPTSTTANFWWSPKAIYEASGSVGSIHDRTEALEAGDNCIGN